MIRHGLYNFGRSETDLSTFKKKASKETRLSAPPQDSRRKKASCEEKKEGPEATHPDLTPRLVPRKEESSWKGTHFTLQKRSFESAGDKTVWRIVISRKQVRLATGRNRWKRRIREVFRRHQASVRPGHEIFLRLRSGTAQLEYREIEREILELLQKSGLLAERKTPC